MCAYSLYRAKTTDSFGKPGGNNTPRRNNWPLRSTSYYPLFLKDIFVPVMVVAQASALAFGITYFSLLCPAHLKNLLFFLVIHCLWVTGAQCYCRYLPSRAACTAQGTRWLSPSAISKHGGLRYFAASTPYLASYPSSLSTRASNISFLFPPISQFCLFLSLSLPSRNLCRRPYPIKAPFSCLHAPFIS